MARLNLDQANSLAILDVVYRVTRKLIYNIMLILEAVRSQWQITMVKTTAEDPSLQGDEKFLARNYF
jgi:hypothetical protein